MVKGTRYRYLLCRPDLLSAMVGALFEQMPMSSHDFMAAVRNEWGLLISQESVADTALVSQLDGVTLARNARYAERLLIDAASRLVCGPRNDDGRRTAKRK